MKNPAIMIVSDGKDKQKTYRETKVRYNLAIAGGFYGEALLINYAIIEDRLKSFLYYSGAITEKNGREVRVDNPRFIKTFDLVTDKNRNGDSKEYISVRDISKKVRVIRHVLKKISSYDGTDEYILMIRTGLGSDDAVKEFANKLNSLMRRWAIERNEITHGLLNKNVDDLKEKYLDICDRGRDYADFFDNIVKSFKSRVKIRDFLGLKTDK